MTRTFDFKAFVIGTMVCPSAAKVCRRPICILLIAPARGVTFEPGDKEVSVIIWLWAKTSYMTFCVFFICAQKWLTFCM